MTGTKKKVQISEKNGIVPPCLEQTADFRDKMNRGHYME